MMKVLVPNTARDRKDLAANKQITWKYGWPNAVHTVDVIDTGIGEGKLRA